MRAFRNAVACGLAIAAALGASQASALTWTGVEVQGSSNIFRAPGGSVGDGELPTQINFAAGPGLLLSFANVGGSIDCCTGSYPFYGPDGADHLASGDTAVDGARGIKGGELTGAQGFLVGVFLNSSALPTTGDPGMTDFTGTTADASFAPALNESFFIGDGLTGTGSGDVQEFVVPELADILVLGLLDGSNFMGAPNFYDDNDGAFTMDVTIADASPVPLPAALPLAGVGMALLGLVARRRRG